MLIVALIGRDESQGRNLASPGALFDVFNPATRERIARDPGVARRRRRGGRGGPQGAAQMGGALRL